MTPRRIVFVNLTIEQTTLRANLT